MHEEASNVVVRIPQVRSVFVREKTKDVVFLDPSPDGKEHILGQACDEVSMIPSAEYPVLFPRQWEYETGEIRLPSRLHMGFFLTFSKVLGKIAFHVFQKKHFHMHEINAFYDYCMYFLLCKGTCPFEYVMRDKILFTLEYYDERYYHKVFDNIERESFYLFNKDWLSLCREKNSLVSVNLFWGTMSLGEGLKKEFFVDPCSVVSYVVAFDDDGLPVSHDEYYGKTGDALVPIAKKYIRCLEDSNVHVSHIVLSGELLDSPLFSYVKSLNCTYDVYFSEKSDTLLNILRKNSHNLCRKRNFEQREGVFFTVSRVDELGSPMTLCLMYSPGDNQEQFTKRMTEEAVRREGGMKESPDTDGRADGDDDLGHLGYHALLTPLEDESSRIFVRTVYCRKIRNIFAAINNYLRCYPIRSAQSARIETLFHVVFLDLIYVHFLRVFTTDSDMSMYEIHRCIDTLYMRFVREGYHSVPFTEAQRRLSRNLGIKKYSFAQVEQQLTDHLYQLYATTF